MDSTDRERISVTREELYKMLAHEVSRTLILCVGDGVVFPFFFVCFVLFNFYLCK